MPAFETDIARERFGAGRLAHLGTVDAAGRAHVVPVVFALDGDTAYSPIDHKPKTTPDLVRVRNIARDPRVTMLADHWDEDWTRLWWVRARGVGSILEGGPDWEHGARALTAKYPQYRDEALTERMLRIDVTDWTSWAWTP